ncbi:MAG TPA: hypothetical protein VMW50_07555 [Dehalococcoidia bacterium]|nr:hypothetical protein [Dehalococcoidia bacterium]
MPGLEFCKVLQNKARKIASKMLTKANIFDSLATTKNLRKPNIFRGTQAAIENLQKPAIYPGVLEMLLCSQILQRFTKDFPKITGTSRKDRRHCRD